MLHLHEFIDSRQTAAVAVLLLSTVAGACATEESMPDANDGSQPTIIETLGEALTFHSSFDSDTDADFGLGDRKIYTAPSYDELEKAEAGIHDPDIVLAAGEGRFGSALRFQKKK